jgi:hypothetical protein
VPIAGGSHILFGSQETGEFEFVSNRPPEFEAEEHVRVPNLAFAPTPFAQVPAFVDLIKDRAQRQEGKLLATELVKDLLEAPGRPT